jgi:AcrR family transcriptional regulator
MGRPSMSEESIRANKVMIIRAAMDMIRESGIQSVSARPLGARVGMNSALIYRYFRDIDEVILFACVHVLQEYSEEMVSASRLIPALTEGSDHSEPDDKQIYLLSWELFCKHAFSNPDEYTYLFFSKHSAELERIIKEYYVLFPHEQADDSDIILEAMFRTSNLASRNLFLLIPVLDGKHTEQEIILINDITVSFFYSLLSQLSVHDEGATAESQTQRMLHACRFLADL